MAPANTLLFVLSSVLSDFYVSFSRGNKKYVPALISVFLHVLCFLLKAVVMLCYAMLYSALLDSLQEQQTKEYKRVDALPGCVTLKHMLANHSSGAQST